MNKRVEEEFLKSLCCPEDASMDEALQGFNKNLASMRNYVSYLKTRLSDADVLGFGEHEKQHLENAIRVGEVDAFIWFIVCDLLVYLKLDYYADKMGSPGYEQLCIRRQFIVIMNEGFKRIYHFKNENNNNKDRNASLWVKDIKKIIEEENVLEGKDIYKVITECLDNFETQIVYLRPFRDCSIHYFQKKTSPIDLYDKLEEIAKNEKLTEHICDFIFILRMMRLLLLPLHIALGNTLKKNGGIDSRIKIVSDIGLEDPDTLKKMWHIAKEVYKCRTKPL